MVLALVLLLGLLPPPLASAAGTSTYNGKSYSTDYTTWRQGNSAWGPTALGDVHTMTQSGCLISSIAILMCSSGAYNPASLNPGSLRDGGSYGVITIKDGHCEFSWKRVPSL